MKLISKQNALLIMILIAGLSSSFKPQKSEQLKGTFYFYKWEPGPEFIHSLTPALDTSLHDLKGFHLLREIQKREFKSIVLSFNKKTCSIKQNGNSFDTRYKFNGKTLRLGNRNFLFQKTEKGFMLTDNDFLKGEQSIFLHQNFIGNTSLVFSKNDSAQIKWLADKTYLKNQRVNTIDPKNEKFLGISNSLQPFLKKQFGERYISNDDYNPIEKHDYFRVSFVIDSKGNISRAGTDIKNIECYNSFQAFLAQLNLSEFAPNSTQIFKINYLLAQ